MEKDNPLFYGLLKEFEKKTGCPMLINTSFNVCDEPIVCSPDDAYRCFMSAEIDSLAIGPYYLQRENQKTKIPFKAHGEVSASNAHLALKCLNLWRRFNAENNLRYHLHRNYSSLGSLEKDI